MDWLLTLPGGHEADYWRAHATRQRLQLADTLGLCFGLLLHAVSAVVLIAATIMHVYAVIWVKGTARAMTRGTVTEGWARTNHALWYRDMTKGR